VRALRGRGVRAPVLIVAGSRNPVTWRQVDFLRARVPRLERRIVPLHGGTGSGAIAGDILLTLPAWDPTAPSVTPLRAAARLADATAQAIAPISAPPNTRRLILTGGDIAAAVCRRLGAEALEIVGAVEDGFPLLQLRGGIADGALAVTKAGGFGTEESLYRAYKLLSEDR